jgi:hypothetical protein
MIEVERLTKYYGLIPAISELFFTEKVISVRREAFMLRSDKNGAEDWEEKTSSSLPKRDADD